MSPRSSGPASPFSSATKRSDRPILPRPRPPTEASPDASSLSDLPPSRRKQAVGSACQACQSRKVKCDGGRPTCGPCRARAQSCVYRLEPGLTMREHLKRKQSKMQENVESFASLYQYLQSRPAEEAHVLFAQIRKGFPLQAALDFVKTQEGGSASGSGYGSGSGSGSSPDLEDRDPPNARAKWSQQIHDCNLLFEQETLSVGTSDLVIQGLRDGVACYFASLGTMFPVITESEVEGIIATFLGRRPELGAPVADTLTDRKVAYGELLAICAVGFQYDRQKLPNGNSSVCTPFYQKARLFLDYVMEKAPLRAMRMCCCLGIYNVIAKSSLAVSYTDWGITLGSTEGLVSGRRPTTLSDSSYTSYLRTFKVLITLRCWVTATLGHIPSPEVARCIHDTGEQMDNTGLPDCTEQNVVIDMLQQSMARITVIKANILRTVACFRVLSPATLRRMQEDLDSWRSNLPPYMRLEALVKPAEVTPDQRRVIFYMHLFYMSALILKARALLSNQRVAASLSTYHPEVNAAIVDGLHAARNSARLLRTIYIENAVVKNCWLTMHQCYVTFLALNYAAVKNLVGAGDPEVREQDQVLSSTCIDILALCATKDKIGRSFHMRLLKIQGTLEKHLPKPTVDTPEEIGLDDDYPCDDSYLFLETERNTPLHRLMHDLLTLLCYPLTLLSDSTDDKLLYPTLLESSVNTDINFVHHLASPFNMDEDVVPCDLFPPVDSLQELCGHENEEEGFVSGSVPYGWNLSAWNGDSGVESPSLSQTVME